MIRKLITNYLNENIKNKESVAILFSGGMDSLSILLSCIELGIKPTLYTFYLDTFISDDIKQSRKISNIFDLRLIEVEIKTKEIDLLKDVEYIIKKFKTNRKTAIQCIQPLLYLMNEVTEEYILTGLCADDLFGTPRSMAKYSNNIEIFNDLRISKFNNKYSSSYEYLKIICKETDKGLIAPYKEDVNIFNYMMKLTYKEMNSPKQKNIIYEDYQEIKENSLYRRNNNLQCGSKIREWHDNLLLNVDINYKMFKSVTGIYNQIFNGMGGFNNG